MSIDTIAILNLLMTGARLALLLALFVYFTYEWKDKPIYARAFGWTMGYACFDVFAEIACMLATKMDTPFAYGLNTMFVFPAVPCFALFSYTLAHQEATVATCLRRLSLHEIPFIISLIIYIAGYHDMLIYTSIYSAIYSIAVFTHIQHVVRRYNKNLSNSFAYTEGRDLHWVSTIMWLLLLLVTIFMVSRYIANIPMNMLFIVTSLTLYYVISKKLRKQQPTDTSILEEAGKGEHIILWNGDDDGPDTGGEEKGVVDNSILSEEDEAQFISSEVRDMIGANLHKAIHAERIYLNADISIRDLATHIGTNTAYLSYYLNTVLGKRFSTYINDMRLAHAERLLIKEPDTSIEEIAMHSGFNSVTTMQRLFSTRNNCTPSQFRQINVNQGDTIYAASISSEDSDINRETTPREYKRLLSERYPRFEELIKVQFPKLTKKEVTLCSLIVLGYSNTIIAELLGINENSLNVTRSRLRTKLQLSRTDNLRVMLTQSVTASPVTN